MLRLNLGVQRHPLKVGLHGVLAVFVGAVFVGAIGLGICVFDFSMSEYLCETSVALKISKNNSKAVLWVSLDKTFLVGL